MRPSNWLNGKFSDMLNNTGHSGIHDTRHASLSVRQVNGPERLYREFGKPTQRAEGRWSYSARRATGACRSDRLCGQHHVELDCVNGGRDLIPRDLRHRAMAHRNPRPNDTTAGRAGKANREELRPEAVRGILGHEHHSQTIGGSGGAWFFTVNRVPGFSAGSGSSVQIRLE